jgi:hypothetical protein
VNFVGKKAGASDRFNFRGWNLPTARSCALNGDPANHYSCLAGHKSGVPTKQPTAFSERFEQQQIALNLAFAERKLFRENLFGVE